MTFKEYANYANSQGFNVTDILNDLTKKKDVALLQEAYNFFNDPWIRSFTIKQAGSDIFDKFQSSITEIQKETAATEAEQTSQTGLEESLGIKDAESKEIGQRKAIVFQDLMGEVPEELSKNPAVQQRVADLSVKMTGDDAPTGPDATRSMLANRARQGILGAASAGGDSSATVGQQSSMRAEANKAIGMKSLAGTEASIQERDAARSALASLKSEVLDSDIKAKEQYKKRQARTAIGLEGIKETARQAAMKGVVINK